MMVATALLLAPVGRVTAQETGGAAAAPARDPAATAADADAPAAGPGPLAASERVAGLERRQRELEETVALLGEDLAFAEQRLEAVSRRASTLRGYLDFGLFATTGNGAGTRVDEAGIYFPEYAGTVPEGWVFMGDPLSTAVNSRGDPADTGESRAILFDSIGNRGVASFIVNTLHLDLFGAVSDTVTVNGAVDLVPRGRDVSDGRGLFLGDFVDVPLAYLEWRPVLAGVELSLFAGKFDSVLGIEYRDQSSSARIGVAPSLLCRYTCGHPLGVKGRAELFDRALNFMLSLGNGSHFSEGFPLVNEIDVNAGKTVAGRVGYRIGTGRTLELGASGALGPQDLQGEEDRWQWHAGADARLAWGDLDVRAEYVRGKAPGASAAGEAPCGLAPCLSYQGAYGLLAYRLSNLLMPYLRVDWRDALHRNGKSFVYISELLRATAGLRAELGPSVILKAEYTLNRELGRIPQFPNDVVTTSAVILF
jgi:hypothetical protein